MEGAGISENTGTSLSTYISEPIGSPSKTNSLGFYNQVHTIEH